jgi:OFA family oxalate/formate antiporter-like MFS transporter
MAAGDLRRALAYPGWRSVFLAFICLFFIFGAPVSTMPLIYGEVMREFHWTRSQVTLGYSFGTWIGAASAIFIVGPLLEKVGLRTLMVAAALLSATGTMGFLFVHARWSYYLCFLPISMGYGAAMIGVKILVSRWYTRNLGVATGIALAGSSLAGVFLPIAWTAITERYGWRVAEACMGASILVVCLPLYLWLAREDPSEEQIIPEALKAAPNPQIAQRMRQADIGLTFGQVLRAPMFWFAALGIMLIQGVDQGMFQHTALYLQNEKHLGREAAAAGLSGMFAVGVFSKILAGWFFDRYSVRGIQLWWLFIGAVVLLAFPVQGGLTLMLFSLARGLAHGGLVAEGPIIAKHCFGPRLMNRVYPVLMGFLSLGSGGGAWVMSAMVDHFGRYREAFILLICAAVLAAAMLFAVRPLYRDRLKAAHTPEEGDDAPAPAPIAGLAMEGA